MQQRVLQQVLPKDSHGKQARHLQRSSFEFFFQRQWSEVRGRIVPLLNVYRTSTAKYVRQKCAFPLLLLLLLISSQCQPSQHPGILLCLFHRLDETILASHTRLRAPTLSKSRPSATRSSSPEPAPASTVTKPRLRGLAVKTAVKHRSQVTSAVADNASTVTRRGGQDDHANQHVA